MFNGERRCHEFGRETDGRTRIQPVYNASSTGDSCLPPSLSLSLPLLLCPVSRPLSFSLLSLPNRSYRDSLLLQRGYPGSAVCTSTPIARAGRDRRRRRRRRRRAFTSINTLGEPDRGEERNRARGENQEDPLARRHRSLYMHAAARAEVTSTAEEGGPTRGWQRVDRFLTASFLSRCIRNSRAEFHPSRHFFSFSAAR